MNQNRLPDRDIDKIVAKCLAFQDVDKYVHRATLAEIRDEHDPNVNIARYLETFEGEEEIEIAAVQPEINAIEAQLAETRQKMAGYLMELGL